jgi:hypothetical protein
MLLRYEMKYAMKITQMIRGILSKEKLRKIHLNLKAEMLTIMLEL